MKVIQIKYDKEKDYYLLTFLIDGEVVWTRVEYSSDQVEQLCYLFLERSDSIDQIKTELSLP